MVEFTPDTCSIGTFAKNFSQSGYFFINAWVDEIENLVVNMSQPITHITFDILTKPPISSFDEVACPTVDFRLTSAYYSNGTALLAEAWQDKVALNMVEGVIKVENFTGVNVNDWSGIYFKTQSRTRNVLSPEFDTLTLYPVYFYCTPEKVINWVPEMV